MFASYKHASLLYQRLYKHSKRYLDFQAPVFSGYNHD